MNAEPRDVLTVKEGYAGRLRLNRPKALNSLNRQMVRDMARALIEWRDDPDVRIILIDHAEGRGFCARDIGADFILGGSGHNAGVINPPSRNKHGFWTNVARPEAADEWLAAANRHEGSWWPLWTQWLDGHGGKKVPARAIKDGIEPAPGSYVMMT